MRINKFVASASGLSRRAADRAIADGRVRINDRPVLVGQLVVESDVVTLDGQVLTPPIATTTIMLSKPAGYVVSRDGQGSPTVYELLPAELHHLKSVGRLDKDSSGLLLLTNDGQLAQQLTHPSYQKEKVYEVELEYPLKSADKQKIEQGIALSDGPSRLQLSGNDSRWTVRLSEGRNRQIRRTFAALNYRVIKLHRTQFGNYKLMDLLQGNYIQLEAIKRPAK